MTEQTKRTYTFANESNSYFMGNDVRVTRDDGESIRINGKDGMVAVCVKDRDAWTYPNDVKPLAADLNTANRSRMANDPYGREDWIDAVLYEQAKERFWEDANELAQQAGFEGVFSAGRSSGWCCINGTHDVRMANILMHPQDDEDFEERDEMFQLLFDIHANIADTRESLYELIREEHAELEHEREQCIVRGTE